MFLFLYRRFKLTCSSKCAHLCDFVISCLCACLFFFELGGGGGWLWRCQFLSLSNRTLPSPRLSTLLDATCYRDKGNRTSCFAHRKLHSLPPEASGTVLTVRRPPVYLCHFCMNYGAYWTFTALSFSICPSLCVCVRVCRSAGKMYRRSINSFFSDILQRHYKN